MNEKSPSAMGPAMGDVFFLADLEPGLLQGGDGFGGGLDEGFGGDVTADCADHPLAWGEVPLLTDPFHFLADVLVSIPEIRTMDK